MNRFHAPLLACFVAAGLCAIAPAARSETFTLNYTKIERDVAATPDPVVALYDRASETLWVDGTDGDDLIRVSVDAGGAIVVNDGAVPVGGGRATVGNTRFISVAGGAGNDVLIDTTGLGAELLGGWGMDVLLWDDFAELDVHHLFAASEEGRDFDLVLVNSPTQGVAGAMGLDGKSLTGTSDDAVVYFDGKLLTARDLTAEQHSVRRGRVLEVSLFDANGDDVSVDGELVDAGSDVGAAGKIIGSDDLGSTALTLDGDDDGRRVVRVTSWQ